MKFFKTTLFVCLVAFIASSAIAQIPNSFTGCGVLSEGVEPCLTFTALDGSGNYLINNIGDYTIGDTVHVIGIIDVNCLTFCAAGEACLFVIAIGSCSNCCVGMRGDLNMDGAVDVSDLMCLIAHAFNVGEKCFDELCIEKLDLNGDGKLSISDFMFLVDYMFHNGPEPGQCSK